MILHRENLKQLGEESVLELLQPPQMSHDVAYY